MAASYGIRCGCLAPRYQGVVIDAGGHDSTTLRAALGNRTQITLSIAPRLLERLDAVARERETSRAALIALWLRETGAAPCAC